MSEYTFTPINLGATVRKSESDSAVMETKL